MLNKNKNNKIRVLWRKKSQKSDIKFRILMIKIQNFGNSNPNPLL